MVNLRGRQAEGSVDPGDPYERVRDRIIETFEQLRDPATGEPVVQWAKRREQLYSGGHLEEAPDVVVLFDPRYKGASGLGDAFEPVPGQILDSYSGVHAMEGVFAIAGPACVRASTSARARSSTSRPRCLRCSGCRCHPTPTAP